MIAWAGWLTMIYGTAHTIGALTIEGAARHVGGWLSGDLRQQSLSTMSSAMSAYWLSINSFGPPLIMIGLIVVWLHRHGITPPMFIPWALGVWVVLGVVVIGPGAGQDLILLVACSLLTTGAHRKARRGHASTSGRRSAGTTGSAPEPGTPRQ